MKYFLISFLLFIASLQAIAQIEPLDKIIVVVNDDVITQHELTTKLNEYKVKLRLTELSDDDKKALEKQVLEKMIRTKIQLQHAKKLSISVDDVALNRVLQGIAKGNKLTLSQLRKAVESEGLNFSDFREQTRQEVIIKQLQQRMVSSKITVTDQEIEQFIKTNNENNDSDTQFLLSHILISTPETAKPADIQLAKEKANKLYNDIINGSDFSDVALRHSNGRNALKGGNLGWRKANELPIAFLDAIENLNTNEVAKPIRSASGFHILKVMKSSREKELVSQTHSRHILIRTGANTTNDQAKATLLKLRQQILSGGKFSDLATKYSQDPGSKNDGGDLGWANPGTFVPAFETAMNDLKPGEISEPFQSQFGWHILQVMERRIKDNSKEVAETKARKVIRNRKSEEELQLWIRRIHDEAYIEYKSTSSSI